ncbi:MAG: DoxX family protein [Cellvibrio sp.]|jgi:uncharacterized membrane protein YphA (DoxX/SURF4 family)
MNILLWILQILLALHTLMGAIWKFSHSAEQTMPSLKVLPSGLWLTLGGVEILLCLCLILPAFYKPLALLVPLAAIGIALEMLLFCGIHLSYSDNDFSSIIYWLVVAGVCAFIAYGRSALRPF